MVTLTIDGTPVSVPRGTSIIEAAKLVGRTIPSLCYLKGINEVGACRICVVEAEGAGQLVAACTTCAEDGMAITTNSPRVRQARRQALELILAHHDAACTTCVRNGTCQLQDLARDLGMAAPASGAAASVATARAAVAGAANAHAPRADAWPQDAVLIRDAAKCVQCLRCVNVCDRVQDMSVWQLVGSGSQASVQLAAGGDPRSASCTFCGQCVAKCPTGALHERDDVARVLAALADPDTVVVAQMAPAVRTAWAETLGIAPEEATATKLVGALKAIGFSHVFDTTLSADFTIMEEGSELIERLSASDAPASELPLFTSCCPGWYRFVTLEYPQLTPSLSSAKSPQQMLGALLKTYFAERLELGEKRIFSVSLMPCMAKKHEAAAEEFNRSGSAPDVDAVLTTRELARLIAACNIDVASTQPQEFDSPLGASSGSGVIFGMTGGVMEAALRTAYCILNGKKPEPNTFRYNLAESGCWKEGTFDLGNRQVRVAVAHGLANARTLVETILAKEAAYDFVEVMACPNGCIGGGGQPISLDEGTVERRRSTLTTLDVESNLRFSHENPIVQQCYEEFLGQPLSPRAMELLHVKGAHHE